MENRLPMPRAYRPATKVWQASLADAEAPLRLDGGNMAWTTVEAPVKGFRARVRGFRRRHKRTTDSAIAPRRRIRQRSLETFRAGLPPEAAALAARTRSRV